MSLKDVKVGDVVVAWSSTIAPQKMTVTRITKTSIQTDDGRRWTMDGRRWGEGSNAFYRGPTLTLWDDTYKTRFNKELMAAVHRKLCFEILSVRWDDLSADQLVRIHAITKEGQQ